MILKKVKKIFRYRRYTTIATKPKWKYLKFILALIFFGFLHFMYPIVYINLFNLNIFYSKVKVHDTKINKVIYKNRNCFFEKFDIWSDIVFNYIRPQKKFEKCRKIRDNEYYKLVDGVITILKDDLYCFCSCIYTKNNFKLNFNQYIYIDEPSKLDCDTFHLRCTNISGSVVYDDVHFHVNKLNKLPRESTNFLKENFSIPLNNKRYDVHIYVINSLSYYHALRALPKTRKLLKEKLNGIEMEYLNAIGADSRLNAYGFLLNKQNMDVDDFFSLSKTKRNDFGDLDPCKIHLDNKTFIQEYYRKMGYVTLSVEDFTYGGIFNYPECFGFKKEPAHHTLKPLQALSLHPIMWKLVKDKFEKKCYHHGFHMMDYMSDFLQKYKNNIKMTLIWQTNIVYGNLNNIFAADDIYYKFFKENIKHYNNSFSILMSDHGDKTDIFSITDIGRYERKNPYFIITIPGELRSNEQLVKNLKENSKKHISHFDIYATLLDILTNAPKDGFKMLDKQKDFPIESDTIKGLSLLRPLPYFNRTCYDMSIPRQYCLCKPKFELLPFYMEKKRTKIKKSFIKALNNKLVEGNLTEKCTKMKLDRSEKFLIKFARVENSKIVYKIYAVTFPGKAKFYAKMGSNFEIINNEIIRLDVHKEQAEPCAKYSNYIQYCYCKSLLS